MAEYVLLSTRVPAVLRTYMACPRCGVTEKPAKTIQVSADVDTQPERTQVALSCERCGEEGVVIVLERRPLLH